MEYVNFRITNFKGISDQSINLDKPPRGRIFSLVGLNESGKTTVLEAISLLEAREKHLESLYQEDFGHDDVHDFIPMKKKANFNDSIRIAATISLSDHDKKEIAKYAEQELSFKFEPVKLSDTLKITKELQFKNSSYQGTKNLWPTSFSGVPVRGKKNQLLYQYDKKKWEALIALIKTRIPSILYFPTFLFEFPQRIYVSEDANETPTNAFYRSIVQDILDSLDSDLDIDQHIVHRARDGSVPVKRALDAVLVKMSTAISQMVFKMWNEIFSKNISRRDIVVRCDTEDTLDATAPRVFLEFSIKDGNEVYLITERSLGFRWFFCFMLFTQFRQYRKEQKNTLFLFDEPASNLHLRAQAQLLRGFTQIIDEGYGKIVYSTHSHHMINPKWLENTFIVSNGGVYDTDESMYEYSSRDTDIRVSPYREFASRHPNKESYFQPILDTLDYNPSNLEYVTDAVFVEGKNDFYMIKYFEEVVSKKGDRLAIVPGKGAGDFDTLISLYLGWGKKVLILLDDDAAGRKSRDRHIEEWNLAKSQVLTLADVSSHWTKFKMEKLFSEGSVQSIRDKFYPNKRGSRLTKKEIARALQEKLIKGDRGDVSAETKATFKQLISGLKAKLLAV